MTNKEMTEIFSVMLLAWPNAEVFKGGIAKLGPTIKLWTQCAADVDAWTGQRAAIQLCKTCKYPPTIAEFLNQVGEVRTAVRSLTGAVLNEIHISRALKEPLHPKSLAYAVVQQAGGMNALTKRYEDGKTGLDYDAVRAACEQYARREPARLALPGGK